MMQIAPNSAQKPPVFIFEFINKDVKFFSTSAFRLKR